MSVTPTGSVGIVAAVGACSVPDRRLFLLVDKHQRPVIRDREGNSIKGKCGKISRHHPTSAAVRVWSSA